MADSPRGNLAEAKLCGTLEYQPVAQRVPLAAKLIARTNITVEGQQYPVVAHGELATELAGTPQGSIVAVRGKLLPNEWTVGKGKIPRRRMEILIEELRVCQKPSRPFKGSVVRTPPT